MALLFRSLACLLVAHRSSALLKSRLGHSTTGQGEVLRKDINNYGIVVAQITETRVKLAFSRTKTLKTAYSAQVTQAKKMDILEGMANDTS